MVSGARGKVGDVNQNRNDRAHVEPAQVLALWEIRQQVAAPLSREEQQLLDALRIAVQRTSVPRAAAPPP